MDQSLTNHTLIKPTHTWLRKIRAAYLPGPATSLQKDFAQNLLDSLRRMGHTVESEPDPETEVLITTALFGEVVDWRKAPLFTAKKRYGLQHVPALFTLIHCTPDQFNEKLAYFQETLKNEQPNPADYNFPGLAERAYHTLHEQGRRGGPIMVLVRLLQSQSKSVRIILMVGENKPQEAYTFDLVGAYPRTDAGDPDQFYDDLSLRIVTAASTREITKHQVIGDPIPQTVWRELSAPASMRQACRELGRRDFFTEMVRVDNLVNVPYLNAAVANQYSEGCFATWEPKLDALISTITGSARPVDKNNLGDEDLAVIAGVRPDGLGALIRQVEEKQNDPPSSEAVEQIQMDASLPKITLGPEWGAAVKVPVARSKLHGHRGVRSYDPRLVEHVYLDPPYYHYPVSCSTQAQAGAIQAAFSRSEALQNPADPRQLVFTILPGHGLVIVEKWVAGKTPLQMIWEAMDDGRLEIDNRVPQGPLHYEMDAHGKSCLCEDGVQ